MNCFSRLALVLSLPFFVSCNVPKNVTSEQSTSSNTPEPIRYAAAEAASVEDAIDVAARVQPDPATVVHVYSPLSGRVLRVSIRPGDRVRKGQVVALVQSSDLASARADYEKARIDTDRARASEKRSLMLFQHEVLAAKDYEEAKAQAATAQTEMVRASERLSILGARTTGSSDVMTLVAPHSGVVIDTAGAAGELSKSLDNANSLATIADLDHVWVLGDVFEKDLSYARAGNIVELSFDAYPGSIWRAKIDVVSSTIDPQTRTARIRVVLPNRDRHLKPEMFGVMHLSRGRHDRILVPAEAVLRDGDATFVFVHEPSDTNIKRNVQLGRSDLPGSKLEVLSGLKSGEKVVVSGAELLRGEGGQ
ncbi:MAG: hypothetical protein NVS9B15_14490 [Acidobacteriaceae bacterium]